MALINFHDELIIPAGQRYRLQVGRHVASGLSGFIFGFLSATLVALFILVAAIVADRGF